MKIFETTDFELDGSYSVAIGKFDGIHRGHQHLIDVIMEYRKEGYKTAVFTFEPSPVAFFGDGTYKGITTKNEKRHIFEKLGIDVLVEYPLNKDSAALSPEAFVKNILIDKMHTKVVACGPDFTFGNKGTGKVDLLQEMGKQYDFAVRVCDKVKADAFERVSDGRNISGVEGICQSAAEDTCIPAADITEISSTLIRQEIMAGKMELANKHIGAYYSVTGVVTKGKQIGRTIGLPTINIVPEEDKLLPPYGVYEAMVSLPSGRYKGITNVGVKPTVTDEKQVVVETFILDYEGDLYGKTITVNLLRMVRPEQKFESVEKLKQQIESDIKFITEGHR